MVYPEFPDTFWGFKHALKFIHKKAALPPLGLLTVAAMLPAEWGKRVVDLNVRGLTKKDMAWADCAFVGGMVVQRTSAYEVIAQCKEAGLKVVAGGPLFTSEHEQFKQVDHFVLGEAEMILPEFLADFQKGQAKHIYKASGFPDMRSAPIPLWHLADLKRYAGMCIQYSRGCPFSCDFCNVTALFGYKVRTKSPEQVIAELDALYDAGWNADVFFVDDNFIGNKNIIKADLLPALIKWRQKRRPGVLFYTEASINIADDDELMAMMVKAGFDRVFIGIETPDELSLAECSKKQNRNRDLVADVKRIQRAGLQVQGGFIVGFDSDKPSIFQRLIDFIQKSGIVTAMVGMLQAPPGTKLYDRLKGEGRLVGRSTGDNVDGTTNIIPRMSIDALHEGYRKILQHIYEPKHYYKRVRTFLREYKNPGTKTKPRFQDFMAFLRSIYVLGVIGRERFSYWKLLIWTGICRPKLFQLAVTLAIYGYHFRKMCEKHVFTRPARNPA
jgi:radical SAM superfamily enzyme YgiQ (UPF0313 family)